MKNRIIGKWSVFENQKSLSNRKKIQKNGVESDWVEKEWWGRNKRLYKKINKVIWEV